MDDFLQILASYQVHEAYLLNLLLTLVSFVIALFLGTLLAIMRISPIASMRLVGSSYVTLIRNTPLTVIMVFSVLVLWPILGVEFSTIFPINFFWLAVMALSFYHAAFFCEALRSGINTVPAGQAEAARSIGLGFVASARLIIIPQAFRGAIAPLGNTLIALIKNTTIAAAASVQEVSIVMGDMIERHSNYSFTIFLTIAAGFVVLVIPVGLVTTLLSQRLAVNR